MKLWLLKRESKFGPMYDVNNGFVIRAESEAQARNIASDHHGDEGIGFWLTDKATCEELLPEGDVGIILQDFNAG